MTDPVYTREELAAAEADVPPLEPDNGIVDNEADHIVEEDSTEGAAEEAAAAEEEATESTETLA